MKPYIHIWSSNHGVPYAGDEAAAINNRLTNVKEAVPLTSVLDLLNLLTTHYQSVSIVSAGEIEMTQEENNARKSSPGQTPSTPNQEIQLWSNAPLEAYARFLPAVLRIGLPLNLGDLYPCVYELLCWCQSNHLVACTDEEWPEYWVPDEIRSDGKRQFANSGASVFTALSDVIQPNRSSSEATRGSWKTVANVIAPLIEAEGFTYDSNWTNSYGRLAAYFRREVVGGIQKIQWTLGIDSVDQEQSSIPMPLNLRVCIRMSMDVMDAANEALNINHIGDNQYILDHSLSDFSSEQFPNGSAKIEQIEVLRRIEELFRTRLLPLLNKCSTPKGAMDAVKELEQDGLKPEMMWILPRLALAWHVQDLPYYNKLKDFFFFKMKAVYSSEEDRDELMHLFNGVGNLQRMPPKYFLPSGS